MINPRKEEGSRYGVALGSYFRHGGLERSSGKWALGRRLTKMRAGCSVTWAESVPGKRQGLAKAVGGNELGVCEERPAATELGAGGGRMGSSGGHR